MNRHHLIHVYTGLRTEIERLASTRPVDAAGASSDAIGMNVRSEIVRDLSRLLWDANDPGDIHRQDIH